VATHQFVALDVARRAKHIGFCSIKIKGGEKVKTLVINYTDACGKRHVRRRSSSNEKILQYFLNSFLKSRNASKTDIYLQLDLFEESG